MVSRPGVAFWSLRYQKRPLLRIYVYPRQNENAYTLHTGVYIHDNSQESDKIWGTYQIVTSVDKIRLSHDLLLCAPCTSWLVKLWLNLIVVIRGLTSFTSLISFPNYHQNNHFWQDYMGGGEKHDCSTSFVKLKITMLVRCTFHMFLGVYWVWKLRSRKNYISLNEFKVFSISLLANIESVQESPH